MALETATYIDDLVTSNPSAADPTEQGDDHIRMIKTVLKNTFPNLDGPCSGTPADLSGGWATPPGVITLWYGSAANVPEGWGVCDGTEYNLADGSGTIQSPDLRDRAIVGAGATYSVGQAFGSISATTTAAGAHTHTANATSNGGHNHGGRTGDHTLTVAQMPKHRHGRPMYTDRGNNSTNRPNHGWRDTNDEMRWHRYFDTLPEGGDQPHSHTISTDGAHSHTVTVNQAGSHTHTIDTRQPSLALHFIMKL